MDLNLINKDFKKFLNEMSDDFDKENILKAFDFAKKSHLYQKRKSGEPFVAHPVEVAKMVYNLGLDSAAIISSLLHDVVEDTDTTLEDLREEFGEEVGMIVDGLTKITSFGRKSSEINVYALRKVLLASAKDIRILIIKLVDRLHNMRTIGDLSLERQIRISTETLNIYVPIAQKIGMYSLKWELEDLALKYRDPEMYQFIKKKLNMKRIDREKEVNLAVEEIKDILNIQDLDSSVLGRPKNFYSIFKKIRSKARSFDEIQDLYAIRIIVSNVSECYTALGIIHENFRSFPNKLKDYIANPKSNGYQSLHTVIFSRKLKCPVEVQIRTEEMHKLAEFGIAAHWRYKNLKEDKKFEKKIGWLREVLEWEKEHKDNKEFLNSLKFDFFEDEIFVFTPKNDVILLPENSTVLDFAYAVHTEIGSKAYKSKVNGAMSTIDRTLNSGDIVEIVMNKTVKPSDKWLKFVKTNKARIKIRQAIQLKHSGKQVNEDIDFGLFEKLKSKITRIDEYKKVRKAGCCEFAYGDQLVGVFAKNKELVVHNASCDNAKYTLNKKIQLRWKEEKQKEITITLIVKDKIGLLLDILNVFHKSNVSATSINSKAFKNGEARITLTLLDGPHVDKISKELKDLDMTLQVKVNRGLFA